MTAIVFAAALLLQSAVAQPATPEIRNFLQVTLLFEGPWSILQHKPPSDSVN